MIKIYVAGKISGECETPELMQKCNVKFEDYGCSLTMLHGNTYPLSKGGIDFLGNEIIGFTHGLSINHDLINSVKGGTYEQYMKNDITTMLKCDEVHFLPDWKNSKGARMERRIAGFLKMKIIDVR